MLWLEQGICFFNRWILIYYIIFNAIHILLLVTAFIKIFGRMNELKGEWLSNLAKNNSLPEVSIIVPAYNEQKHIINSVYSLERLSYPQKQIVVVNDGSTDNTLDILKKELDLMQLPILFNSPIETKEVRAIFQSRLLNNVLVVDKERGGKGDALNAGINAVNSTLFVSTDADTILENDSLLKMVSSYLMDPRTIAHGATIRIANGCKIEDGLITNIAIPKTMLEGAQVIEYLRSFFFGRFGWNSLGGNLIISGALGLFNREAVLRCGGYMSNSVAEDIELTVSLSESSYLRTRWHGIRFLPDAFAWTHAPENIKTLKHQRIRWHMALIETMNRYKKMCFNPQYKLTGFLVIPYYIFGELMAPIVQVIAYFSITSALFLELINMDLVILFTSATLSLSLLQSAMAVMMEITVFRRFRSFKSMIYFSLYTLFDLIILRQLYCLWKIHSFAKWIRKENLKWYFEEKFDEKHTA